MMINCPKCGFNQPKDEFCANCGVDMDVFGTAQRKSQMKLSIVYVVSGVAIIALVLAFAGRRAEKVKNLASEIMHDTVAESQRLLSARVKLDNIAGGKPSGQTASADAPRKPQVETEAGGSASAPSAAPTYDGMSGRSPMIAANAALSDHSSASSASSSPESPHASKLRVEMMIIESRLAREISAQSQGKEQSGEAEFGIFSDMDKKLRDATSQGVRSEPIHQMRPQLKPGEIVTAGTEIKGKNLGFDLTLVPVTIEQGQVTLQIEHSFFQSAEERERPQYGSRTTLKVGFKNGVWESIWIRGVLRHVAEELGQFGSSSSILKVLTRPEFLDGSSEFFVVVSPQ